MEHSSLAGRLFQGVALALVLVFFMFPIVWIFLMSFQSNEQILRIPPSILFEPTLFNYQALISGQLRTTAGNLEISFMRNLMNSFVLSSAAVLLALLLGVPAAYAFARFKFRLGETIAFTLLSFRFAPPLLVLLPLSLYYQQLGLNDTYFGIVWVYQLIALPLILWIVRGTLKTLALTSSMPIGWPGIPGARPSRASRCRWPGPASRLRGCCLSSSAGTISSLR